VKFDFTSNIFFAYLASPLAQFAVKAFDRKGRKGLRKDRKEELVPLVP
jgi:hypothetical protein